MSIRESIEKLLEGNNEEDLELAAILLESESFSMEEKKEYIQKYIEQNTDKFTENELKLLKTWLETKNNNTENLLLWILRNR